MVALIEPRQLHASPHGYLDVSDLGIFVIQLAETTLTIQYTPDNFISADFRWQLTDHGV